MRDGPTVKDLVSAGRHAQAAALAREQEDWDTACRLYEIVWDFAAAAECASVLGEPVRALGLWLAAADAERVQACVTALETAPAPLQRQALELLESRRQSALAARIAAALGEFDRAGALYRQAGLPLEAAAALTQAGATAQAVHTLEHFLGSRPSHDDAARAHLALGRLLRHLRQDEAAARHLQRAATTSHTASAALSELPFALHAMGLPTAAQAALDRARDLRPELPDTLHELMRRARTPTLTGDKGPARLLGRYRILQLLGQGAAGRVFLAQDELGDDRVAIKQLFAGSNRDPLAYERFLREARVLTQLRHPHIVALLTVHEDQALYVMEHLPGGTLEERLRPRLSPGGTRRLGIDLATGLAFAHARGVIHRDLKPSNVLYDGRGTAKLADFGVAHLLDLGLTQTGGLIGTLAYMSPEQILGGRISFAADLYGLGVTLYRAITGRLPFAGPDFVAQHLNDSPAPPSAVHQGLSAGWDDLLMALLAKDPGARPPSMDAVIAALTALPADDAGVPLMLIRPRAAAAHVPEPTTAAASQGAPRYGDETPVSEGLPSRTARAVDAVLGRTVLIERWYEPPLAPALEDRLLALAAAGGPHLQRTLSYDRERGVAVYEAPVGAPPASEWPHEHIGDLLRAMARALLPLHDLGLAHGSVSVERIAWDPIERHATLLVAGTSPHSSGEMPADDITALLAIACELLNVPALDAPAVLAPDAAAALRTDPPAHARALAEWTDLAFPAD